MKRRARIPVSWPRAEDGVGYVHVSMGSLGQSETGRPVRSPQPTSEAGSSTSAAVRGPAAKPQGVPTPVVYLQAPGHLVGFGGRVGGSNVGFGASARAWSRNRFGVQFDLTRAAMAGLAPTERVTSMQFEPGVLYTLAGRTPLADDRSAVGRLWRIIVPRWVVLEHADHG